MPDPPRLRIGGGIVVVLFLASGTWHLVNPEAYEPIVPDVLPDAHALVLVSGVAELACALGLVLPRTRGAAGLASAALLVAIFPANVQMAWDAWRDWRAGHAGGCTSWPRSSGCRSRPP